jgi:formylglycine-generating enzyme required for sulfatase activity
VDGAKPDSVPSRSNIIAALSGWLWLAKPEDLVLVFFFGHGKDHGAESFLLPNDVVEDNLLLTGVPVSFVRQQLELCKAKQKVLVLDMCHSGGKGGDRMSAALAAAIGQPAGIVTLASCTVDEKSYEWEERGLGVFSYYLADALQGRSEVDRDRDGLLSVDEVYAHVYDGVTRWSARTGNRQTPVKKADVAGEIVLGRASPELHLEPVDTIGGLSVSGSPTGADVFVDGNLKGRIPCAVTADLGEQRERTVEVAVRAAGYRTKVVRITLVRGQTLPWHVELEGSPASAILPGVPRSDNPAGYEFVAVPGGEGVAAFEIGRYEVTVAQFRAFVEATKYRTTAEQQGWSVGWVGTKWAPVPGLNWRYRLSLSSESAARDRDPVCHVTYEDAVAFCHWIGGRLPTHGEWEHAARGGLRGRRFVWGDQWPPPKGAGNFGDASAERRYSLWETIADYDDGYIETAPVGSFQPNGYGLYDMAGNAWELVAEKQYSRGGDCGLGDELHLTIATKRWYDGASCVHVGFRVARTSPVLEALGGWTPPRPSRPPTKIQVRGVFEVISPLSGDYLPLGPVAFRVKCFSPAEVKRVEIVEPGDRTVLAHADTVGQGGLFVAEWDASAAGAGTHEVQVRVYSRRGDFVPASLQVNLFQRPVLSAATLPTVAPPPSSPVTAPWDGRLGETKTNAVDGAEMVFIPGGTFMMGSDPHEIDRQWAQYGWDPVWKQNAAGESPRHRVSVEGFWMYRHEVTAGEYRTFCQATGREPPTDGGWGRQPDDHPAIYVSWGDALAYCEWAGVRLPTEQEWEYAARAGDGRVFPWGDQWDRTKANSASYSVGQDLRTEAQWHVFDTKFPWKTQVMTTPVGSFPANPFGLFDMVGNVYEWCADWYERYPGSTHRGEQYGQRCRVVRGGRWGNHPDGVRCAFRNGYPPDGRGPGEGFRPVRGGASGGQWLDLDIPRHQVGLRAEWAGENGWRCVREREAAGFTITGGVPWEMENDTGVLKATGDTVTFPEGTRALRVLGYGVLISRSVKQFPVEGLHFLTVVFSDAKGQPIATVPLRANVEWPARALIPPSFNYEPGDIMLHTADDGSTRRVAIFSLSIPLGAVSMRVTPVCPTELGAGCRSAFLVYGMQASSEAVPPAALHGSTQ